MLPLAYAVRNLFRVPARFVQIVLGSGLVILLLMLASALSGGMDAVLRSSGSAENVIVLGSGSEESVERSEVKASVPGLLAASVKGLDGEFGQAAVSGEVHFAGMLRFAGGVGGAAGAFPRGDAGGDDGSTRRCGFWKELSPGRAK